uniref:Uncharacterized protein n=1 Tax=Oryza sativa subsp. japonica TaxID=39947 RepID=Q8SAY4_ORYSJ|nr:hypothetical protein [Oryza sativa Japonica Group]
MLGIEGVLGRAVEVRRWAVAPPEPRVRKSGGGRCRGAAPAKDDGGGGAAPAAVNGSVGKAGGGVVEGRRGRAAV